jgi:hypothetical protein
MIIKTKRVDNKHVIVLEILDAGSQDVYLAKRMANGGVEKIPDDEPTIVFRGRDRLALPMLHAYQKLCLADGVSSYQIETLDGMIRAFEHFALTRPQQMKQPGVTRGR